MKRIPILALALFFLLPSAVLPAAGKADARVALMPRTEDYTLLWWADGPPFIRESKIPPASATLCFQSGAWGLAFDTKQVRALRAGDWAKPMKLEEAVQPGRAALDKLPPVFWDCAVVADGRRFTCVGHMETNDEFFQPVRFVESGHFFQRVVIEGLQFADSAGEKFPCATRLEISAWPDRLAFRLELEPASPPAAGTVELRFNDRHASAPLSAKTSLLLVAFGGDSPEPDVTADSALKISFNDALDCHTLQLPEPSGNNGGGNPTNQFDRLDRWRVTLENKSERPTVARLMFTPGDRMDFEITGFTPMLCDTNGAPTGLPVQNSKDWHQRPEKGHVPNEGMWVHEFAFVRLPPKSSHTFLFQMVHARYGGIFAASVAQLCLIGWGHNQFWDQAAIGSFGENICVEPGRVQRRCFIDDVRPLMTLWRKSGQPWNWAENAGGGDFLMWQDAQGNYQPMRATRVNYRAYGPCLTDVNYTEESIGGELAARMDVSVPRSDDYLRAFIHIRYDVRRPMQWQRLAFFQLGADLYNEVPARRAAIGDVKGLREEFDIQTNNISDRGALPLTGAQPWLSLHDVDVAALQSGKALASRGLIVRSWRAKLGGRPASPCVSFFHAERKGGGGRPLAELAPPSNLKELLPGDFVEADLELVVFPADAAAYYGPNKEFAEALARDADTWRPVQHEAAGNNLQCKARRGTVLKPYPLQMELDRNQVAEVTVQGGLGYVPVTFTGLDSPDGYELLIDGQRLDQSVHGNDFWQTDYDPVAQRWRQTFNILLPAGQPHVICFRTDSRQPKQN